MLGALLAFNVPVLTRRRGSADRHYWIARPISRSLSGYVVERPPACPCQ